MSVCNFIWTPYNVENFSANSSLPTSNGIQRALKGEPKGVQLKITDSKEVPMGETLAPNAIVYEITISDDSRQDIAVLVNQASDTFKKAGKPKNCLINIESAFIHENSTNLEIFFVNIIAIIIDGMNIKNSADSIFNGDMRNKNILSKNVDSKYQNFSNESNLIQNRNNKNNNYQIQPPKTRQKEEEEEEDEYMKIKDLRPEEDFIIKVRVSKKGQVQEYWKDSLPSKRLTVTLEDRNGDKINATFFDYYDDFIREGKVYLMEGGIVNETPERFLHTQGPLQLIFNMDYAEITEAVNDDYQTKSKFNFLKLKEIKDKHLSSEIDIAAFVSQTASKEVVVKERIERVQVITIYDDTDSQMDLTLWGKAGQSFTNHSGDLIVFTKVKVTQFKGKLGLSSSFNTQQIQNTKEISSLPRIAQLINCKKPGGNSFNVSQPPQQNESGLSTLAKVCQEMNYAYDKAFFEIRARIIDINIDGAQPYYPCCGVNKECQKKAIQIGQNIWKCGSCSKSFNEPNYRYILNMKIKDHTAELWVKVFDETGETILELDAKSFKFYLEHTNVDVRKKIFPKVLNKEYKMSLSAKIEEFRGNKQVLVQIVKIE